MITRVVSEDVQEILSYFPVIGIIGPRQVGKTTLVKSLQPTIKKEIIYLDLENPEDMVKLTDPVLFFNQNIDKCIILDEIQRAPELFPILRSMVDKKREPSRFILLGSASPDLIRDSSETLAGRIAYQELTPFNLTEVDNATYNDVSKHWFRGGFPNAYLAPTDSLTLKWLFNFIQTYAERDLPLLGLDVDRNTIKKLWTMVAHLNGNILNMSNLGRALELNSNTIKKYLSFLENAFLIRQLQPFSINTKKRLIKSPKIYIRDTGVLHRLLAIQNLSSLELNPMVGNSWEGYVIEQIVQRLSSDIQPYYYRTQDGAECDLVLVKGVEVVACIEIKYTATPKLSRGNLQSFNDLKALNNFVITPDTDTFDLQEHIKACKLSVFLTNYLQQML